LIGIGIYAYFYDISAYVGFVQTAFQILIPEDARTYAELIIEAQIISGALFIIIGFYSSDVVKDGHR